MLGQRTFVLFVWFILVILFFRKKIHCEEKYQWFSESLVISLPHCEYPNSSPILNFNLKAFSLVIIETIGAEYIVLNCFINYDKIRKEIFYFNGFELLLCRIMSDFSMTVPTAFLLIFPIDCGSTYYYSVFLFINLITHLFMTCERCRFSCETVTLFCP